MNAREAAQLVLGCLTSGQIVEVSADEHHLLGPNPIGQRLDERVDEGSAPKCVTFLRSAAQHGGAFGWELNMGLVPSQPLCFAALRREQDRLLVVASKSQAATLRLLEHAVSNHTEAADGSEMSAAAWSWDPLSELAQVNNALVGLQRELAKRNVALTSLTDQRDKLLGILAHDLRTPVTVIKGYCELLEAPAVALRRCDQTMYLQRIQQACDGMKGLLDHTLAEARTAAAAKVRLGRSLADVVELVRSEVETHRIGAARKAIVVKLICDEPCLRARVDPIGIHQVVSNLLSNAIKFSHAESEISVFVSRSAIHLLIAVEDHGQGIPAQELGSLFTPYQTTSVRSTAGETSTGLGLAIVRDVVEAHGGSVSVESTLDRGSTFTVRLPIEA